MKNKLLIPALLMLFSMPAIAQPEAGQAEFSGSIGLVSGRYIGDVLGFNEKVSQTTDNDESISYLISGKYFFNDHIALGGTLGTQALYGSSNNLVVYNGYNFRKVDITIAPEITVVYVTRPWFQFYSLYGLGIAPYSEHLSYDNSNATMGGVNFTKQLTPVAIRFGGQLAGHIEVGLGYKGLLNLGLSYSFGKTRNNKKMLEYNSR